MAFNRPPMTDLVARISSDIESRLPTVDARLRRSNLGVLSRVQAGVAHGLYGYIGWVANQVIVDTAEGEYLERWASVWGIVRSAATPATGTVQFTGANVVAIPVGTVVQRADGVQYATTVAAQIAAGIANVAVEAVAPGAEGNAGADTRLVMAAQIIGINANVTVQAGGLTNGTEVESDDSLRDRLLSRIRNPPQGGAATDYAAWAREVAGVTRVWVKPSWLGAGTVGVFFVRDGDADNIPDAAEIEVVQEYLDARRPVTAEVFALAPTKVPVDMTIAIVPTTPEVKAAVEAELQDMFRRESEPGGTILISHIREAVSLSLGETDHTITVPAGNVVAGPGQMPVLGTITWV